MAHDESRTEDRGRGAEKPSQIPKTGWRDIFFRVVEEQTKDNLSIVAAGVAFYILFSLFPGITALVSIYGIFADPTDVQQQIGTLKGVVPKESLQILRDQISSIASSSSGKLGFGLVIGILLALWSAGKGMKSMITALNIAYDEKEERGTIRFNAVALLLTLGAIVFIAVSLGLIVALPGLLKNIPLPSLFETLISIGRWFLLALFIVFGLALLYRFAPDRSRPKWSWVSWGAAATTVLWIAGSILFSWYVSNFGDYNATYGSMGAVIILLTWLYLTAYLILLGAELNAEMEHQTVKDTTEKGKPMGEREAQAADTLGKKP